MIRFAYNSRNQLGGILPLAAIFSTVILVAAAIAIELNILNAGKEQAQKNTKLAALSCIGEYFTALQDGPCALETEGNKHQCAMEIAVSRVNEISAKNKLVGNKDAALPKVTANPWVDVPLAEADLIPGWWVQTAQLCGTLGLGISCPAQSDENYPTFIRWDEATTIQDETRPNAFRVEGRFYSSGLTIHMLSHIFGKDTLAIPTAAVASFTPRWITFLLDLSPSIASETHLPYTYGGPFDDAELNASNLNGSNNARFCCPLLENGHGNRMAYITIEDNCRANNPSAPALAECPYNSNSYNPQPPSGSTYGCANPAVAPGECMGEDGKFDIDLLSMDREWYFMNNPDPDSSADPHHSYSYGGSQRDMRDRHTDSPLITHHFASDYVRRYVVGDADYANLPADNPGGGVYSIQKQFHPDRTAAGYDTRYEAGPPFLAQVDYYRDSQYQGPQPLTRILQGVKQALTKLQNERVPGDAVGLIAFDNTVDWRTTIKLDINSTDYLAELLDLTIDNEPDDPANYDVTNGLGPGYGRLARLGFFPKRFVFSDVELALQSAADELAAERDERDIPASEHIIIFTDGQCILSKDV